MPVRFRCVCVYPVGEDMQFLGCCVVDNYRSHPVNPNPTRNYDTPPPAFPATCKRTRAHTHKHTRMYMRNIFHDYKSQVQVFLTGAFCRANTFLQKDQKCMPSTQMLPKPHFLNILCLRLLQRAVAFRFGSIRRPPIHFTVSSCQTRVHT